MLATPIVFGLLQTWLTPFWLLSVGVALGVAALTIVFGVLFLVSRPAADFVVTSVREGILLPIFWLAMFMTALAVLAIVVVPGIPFRTVLASASRFGEVGRREWDVTIPASSNNYPLKDLNLRMVELNSFTIQSDKPIIVTTNITST